MQSFPAVSQLPSPFDSESDRYTQLGAVPQIASRSHANHVQAASYFCVHGQDSPEDPTGCAACPPASRTTASLWSPPLSGAAACCSTSLTYTRHYSV